MLKFLIYYLEKPLPITSKWGGVTVRKRKVEHTESEGAFFNLQKFINKIAQNARKHEMRKKCFPTPPPPPPKFFDPPKKYYKKVGNNKKLHKKFKQHPINIEQLYSTPHDNVHVPAKFWEYTAMRFWVTVQKLSKKKFHTKVQTNINIKNYTAHPHDMVHVPAKFRENTAMRFQVTVWKLNVTNRRTDGAGGVAISPIPGLRRGGK